MSKIKKLHRYKKYLAVLGTLLILIFIYFYIINEKIFHTKNEAKILFVGDMFFDRQIRKVMSQNQDDYVFACIKDFLDGFGTVIGNLEGPITKNPSVSLGSEIGSPQNFVFTFPSSTAKLLQRNNVKVVSLGNNHIGNFGADGIASTHKYLDEAHVKYFGGILGDEPILREEIGGAQFSFIAYNQFGGKSAQQVAVDIKAEKMSGRKKEGRVIVFAHWGEEYTTPTEHVRQSAKLFAESGADLIIGAHPHVIQKSEKIGDTEVFYSLGNFIFDQYWNKDVTEGLGVELIVDENNLITKTHMFKIKSNGQTCLVDKS